MIDIMNDDNGTIRIAADNAEKINAALHDAGYEPHMYTGITSIWVLPHRALEWPAEEAMRWELTDQFASFDGKTGKTVVTHKATLHIDDIGIVPKHELETDSHYEA